MTTVDQIGQEIDRLKASIEETKEPLRAAKQAVVDAKGQHGEKSSQFAEAAKALDVVYSRRAQLKADLALMSAEKAEMERGKTSP